MSTANPISPTLNTKEIGIYPTSCYVVSAASTINVGDYLPEYVKWIQTDIDGVVCYEQPDETPGVAIGITAGSFIPVFTRRILAGATINGVAFTTTATQIICKGGV